MIYRHDLAQWRHEQTGDSYQAIADRAGLARMAVCDTIRGKNHKGETNPTTFTVKATFIALGLDPKYIFDFKLKKSQFRRAVVEAAR